MLSTNSATQDWAELFIDDYNDRELKISNDSSPRKLIAEIDSPLVPNWE